MKSSHKFLMATLVAIVSVSLTGLASAQEDRPDRGGRGGRGGPGGMGGGRGPGGPGGGDPVISLLRMDEVRAELEITPDQIEAIKKMGEANRPERPDFAAFGQMSEEERREAFAKMQKAQAERAKEMREQLEEVLLPQQTERLEQISLQQQGVRALMNPDFATKLGLSEDQNKKLVEVQGSLMEEMRTKMREIFSGGGGGDPREKMKEMRAEMEGKVLSVLTDEQRETFESMKGEAFDMPEQRGWGGGGAGRRGGGGDRAGRGDRGGRGRGEGRGRGQGRGRPQSQE